jgi:hypothetical protein
VARHRDLSGAGLPAAAWSGGQSREWYGDGTQWAGGGNRFGQYTLALPIQFGAPVQLEIFALAQAESHSRLANVEVDSVADLGHTIAWGGITNLGNASGAAVSSFTAVSAETGADYARSALAPVDEPPTALQLVLGLLAVVGFARRSGQAPGVRRLS